MLLLILLRLAMSENQRRLTCARFFEVPLTIAVLLLALAALGLKILNRISTHPELISTSLGTP